jgi:hypothetical protein
VITVLATLVVALSAATTSTEPPSNASSSTAAPSTAAAASTSSTTAPLSTQPIPDGYVPLIDDTGSIVVAVPEAWTDITTAPTENEDGSQRPYLAASPDLDSFRATFDNPGVVYSAFPFTADPLTLIDEYGLRRGCETLEVKTYEDPVFVGVVQVGTNCGPNGMTWNMVVANPADESFTALLQVQTASDDELRTVLLTFNYPPEPVTPTNASSSSTTAASPTTAAAASTTVASPTTSTGG